MAAAALVPSAEQARKNPFPEGKLAVDHDAPPLVEYETGLTPAFAATGAYKVMPLEEAANCHQGAEDAPVATNVCAAPSLQINAATAKRTTVTDWYIERAETVGFF